MRVLVDTHALIWWACDAGRLPERVRTVIEHAGSEVHVSAATAWEIATKHRLGKLNGVQALVDGFGSYLASQRFLPLPITVAHAIRAGTLRHVHRDPFDRMLIAQSLSEGLALISNEAPFDSFGVVRIW